MALLKYVNEIPYTGKPYVWVNGFDFHWNGNFWELMT